MKDWLKKNYMRVWVSGVAGLGFGFFCELIYGQFASGSINGFVMLPIIIGSAIGMWFVLKNNKGFGIK